MKAGELKRAVEAIPTPKGMEERLLAAMQDAAAAPQKKTHRRRRWLPLTAAAVLVLCSGTLLVRQGLLRERESAAAENSVMDVTGMSGEADTMNGDAAESAPEETPRTADGESESKLQNDAAAVAVTLRAELTAEGELSLWLENGGARPLLYADAWTLEREENGAWRPLPATEDTAGEESASAATLAPGASAHWLGDVAAYGALAAGEYRVVLRLTVEGESRCAAAVFTVD